MYYPFRRRGAEAPKGEPLPLPAALARGNFLPGMVGDFERAWAAAKSDPLYFAEVASEDLKRIMRDSGEGVVDFRDQKLGVLVQLVKKKGWKSFEEVDIDEFNARLREGRAKGELKKVVDEGNPILEHYQK